MSKINRSLIVPVSLWPNNLPRHNISCILYVPSQDFLVTASDVGHIIVWKYDNSDSKMNLIYYFIGHKGIITKLVSVNNDEFSEMEYVVSFAVENEISLWELTTGRNIEFISNSQWNITNAVCLEVKSLSQRLLFCCNRGASVLVLHWMTLAVLCNLVCGSSPNWFTSIISITSTRQGDSAFLAITLSGMVCLWVTDFSECCNQQDSNDSSIQSSPSKHLIRSIEAAQCVDVEISDPVMLSVNPLHSEVILVMSSIKFKVFHGLDWQLLCYQDCKKNDYFIDVQFVSDSQIVLICRSGKLAVFQLPKKACYNCPEFAKDSANLCDSIPQLLREIPSCCPDIQLNFSLSFSYGSVFCVLQLFEDSIWSKRVFDKDAQITSSYSSDLYQCWPNSTSKLMHFLIEAESDIDSSLSGHEKINVTSLLLMPELSLVAVGLDSGSIYIMTTFNLLHQVFQDDLEEEEDSSSNSKQPFLKLVGHEGPVLTLLHPASALKLPSLLAATDSRNNGKSGNKNYCQPYLNLLQVAPLIWSGGADQTIRLWTMKSSASKEGCNSTSSCHSSLTPHLLQTYHCHSAPVTSLKLHHLPQTSDQFCFGFSQGFTTALYNSVSNDDEERHSQIKSIISMCSNAYIIGIGENDAISIISMMRRKVLLNSLMHFSPVRCLGWHINSGYLLIESVDDFVFVWDLSSGTMDRVERGARARNLMDNCAVKTRIRSRYTHNVVSESCALRRHCLQFPQFNFGANVNFTAATSRSNKTATVHSISLLGPASAPSPPLTEPNFSNSDAIYDNNNYSFSSTVPVQSGTTAISDTANLQDISHKLLRIMYIKPSSNCCHIVPVLCFDIDRIIEYLDFLPSALNTTLYYRSLIDIDYHHELQQQHRPQQFLSSEQSNVAGGSGESLDDFRVTFMENGCEEEMERMKRLLVKIVFRLFDSTLNNLNSLTFEKGKLSDNLGWSHGDVNLQTGCITYNLNNLCAKKIKTNLLLTSLDAVKGAIVQLAVLRKSVALDWINVSNSCSFYVGDGDQNTVRNMNTSKFDKIERDVLNTIIHNVFNYWVTNESPNVPFLSLECLFAVMVRASLSDNNSISKSGMRLVQEAVCHLSYQQVQMYILVWRMIMFPALDGNSHGLDPILDFVFSNPEQVIISVHNRLVSDCLWWWRRHYSNDDDKSFCIRRSNKIRIYLCGLLHISVLGSHLVTDGNAAADVSDADAMSPHCFDTENGSHHTANINTENSHFPDLKVFSKVFELDNYFLARLTSEFLYGIIQRFSTQLQNLTDCYCPCRSLGNLVRFSVSCIGRGFQVWEPYLDANSLLEALLRLLNHEIQAGDHNSCVPEETVAATTGIQDISDLTESSWCNITDSDLLTDYNRKCCSHVTKATYTALKRMAIARPLRFIMACYLEMQNLRKQNPTLSSVNIPASIISSTSLIESTTQRRKSATHADIAGKYFSNQTSPRIMASRGSLFNLDLSSSRTSKNHHGYSDAIALNKFKRIIPILDIIIESYPKRIMSVLSELVELYIFIKTKVEQKFDLSTELCIFNKFSSICINARNGQISVGSEKGIVTLIESRFGKYFTASNKHKKAVTVTQFSDDCKYVASYSSEENMLNVWQISTSSSIFHHSSSAGTGSNPFVVKLVTSQAVPQPSKMLLLLNRPHNSLHNFGTGLTSTTSKTTRTSIKQPIRNPSSDYSNMNIQLIVTHDKTVQFRLPNNLVLKSIKF